MSKVVMLPTTKEVAIAHGDFQATGMRIAKHADQTSFFVKF